MVMPSCYTLCVDTVWVLFGVVLALFGLAVICQNIAIAAHGIRDAFRPPEQRRFVSFVPIVGALSVYLGLRAAGYGHIGVVGFLIDPFWLPQLLLAIFKILLRIVRFLLQKLI